MGLRRERHIRLAPVWSAQLDMVGGGNFQVALRGADVYFRLALSLEKSPALSRRHVNAFLLWLAQGFGIGRIPVAPGTFGSVVGLAWFAVLLLTGNLEIFLVGTLVGVALSVWL